MTALQINETGETYEAIYCSTLAGDEIGCFKVLTDEILNRVEREHGACFWQYIGGTLDGMDAA